MDRFIVLLFLAIIGITFAGFLAFFVAPPLQPFKTWVNPNTLMSDCDKKGEYRIDGSKAVKCTPK